MHRLKVEKLYRRIQYLFRCYRLHALPGCTAELPAGTAGKFPPHDDIPVSKGGGVDPVVSGAEESNDGRSH